MGETFKKAIMLLTGKVVTRQVAFSKLTIVCRHVNLKTVVMLDENKDNVRTASAS